MGEQQVVVGASDARLHICSATPDRKERDGKRKVHSSHTGRTSVPVPFKSFKMCVCGDHTSE